MPITSQINKTIDLTIFKATGALSFDEVHPIVKAFYDGDPTRHVLWDLNETTDIELTSEEIKSIAHFKPRYQGKRKLGKTAFVAQKDILFGLSRMFEIQSNIKEAPYPIMVFRSMNEALQWLDES